MSPSDSDSHLPQSKSNKVLVLSKRPFVLLPAHMEQCLKPGEVLAKVKKESCLAVFAEFCHFDDPQSVFKMIQSLVRTKRASHIYLMTGHLAIFDASLAFAQKADGLIGLSIEAIQAELDRIAGTTKIERQTTWRNDPVLSAIVAIVGKYVPAPKHEMMADEAEYALSATNRMNARSFAAKLHIFLRGYAAEGYVDEVRDLLQAA